MKTKKFALVMATVAFLAIVVGVLVWPSPKSAYAMPTCFAVYVRDNGDAINGMDIVIHYYNSLGQPVGNPIWLDNPGAGAYKSSAEPPSQAYSWDVEMVDGNGYEPELPDAWEWMVGQIQWGVPNNVNWEVQEE